MPANIRHIVFDIGKVLIHYDPDIPFSRLIPDAEERRWFFDNVCTHDWNVEQDRGRTWREAEEALIANSQVAVGPPMVRSRNSPAMRIISAASASIGTKWCRIPTRRASITWSG